MSSKLFLCYFSWGNVNEVCVLVETLRREKRKKKAEGRYEFGSSCSHFHIAILGALKGEKVIAKSSDHSRFGDRRQVFLFFTRWELVQVSQRSCKLHETVVFVFSWKRKSWFWETGEEDERKWVAADSRERLEVYSFMGLVLILVLYVSRRAERSRLRTWSFAVSSWERVEHHEFFSFLCNIILSRKRLWRRKMRRRRRANDVISYFKFEDLT